MLLNGNMINEIVIHKSLLDKFKKDALKYYPNEHIQAILGKQVNSRLDIYAFYDLTIYKRIINSKETSIHYDALEIEIEDSDYKYFGTIHSHPDGPLECSDWDREEFIARGDELLPMERGYQLELLPEKVMGIFQINKLENGCQWGIVFYNKHLEKIPVIVSELRRK